MNERAHPLTAPARDAAMTIVRRHCGTRATVVADEPLGHRWAPVTRLRVRDTGSRRLSSVVVKTVRTTGDGHGGPAFLRRELVAHELARSSGVVAELLGADLEAGVVVLAAIYGPTVETCLLTADAERGGNAFIATGDALGRLHSATIDGAESHRQKLLEHGATGADLDWPGVRFASVHWERLTADVDSLALPAPTGVDEDVHRLIGSLTAGSYDALLHADSNPGNCLMTANGVRLVDFEGSMFGHVGLDLAELDYPYPFYSAHWSTVPAELTEAAVAAYSKHLPPEWRPHLAEIRTEGAASALLHRLLRLPTVAPDDQPPRKRWRRRAQLVQQIDRFLILSGDHLPALRAWLAELREELVLRWPDATDPRPADFPAFGGPYRPTE